MDYTTIANVKAALNIETSGADTLLTRLVTAASRVTDRICTGSPEAEDYFKLETVTDEEIIGQINNHGQLVVFPRKPVITAVSALAYKRYISDDYTDVTHYTIRRGSRVVGDVPSLRNTEVFVKISYTGGLAADVANLPADLVELATLIAGRFYREDEGGLTDDAIGIADFGLMQYTKALPPRAKLLLALFKRQVPY